MIIVEYHPKNPVLNIKAPTLNPYRTLVITLIIIENLFKGNPVRIIKAPR